MPFMTVPIPDFAIILKVSGNKFTVDTIPAQGVSSDEIKAILAGVIAAIDASAEIPAETPTLPDPVE